MSDQALTPFHPPAGFPIHVAISTGAILSWLLVGIFAVWAVYTLVAIYHWVKYSHAATVAYPAIAAHLVISTGLMLYTLSGLV